MRITNADRLVYPDVGWTKGDLVAYYAAVAPTMISHLASRPLTLERFPKGLSSAGFMQKNRPAHYPDDIGVWEVPKNDGGITSYPVIQTEEAIPYLANQGTITFHAWTSTILHPHCPDWLVMDLDPSEDEFAMVREVATVTRHVLDTYGLECLPVATGSKGFHLWVRLDPVLDYQTVGRAARALGAFVVLAAPEIATGEFLKKNRAGRVFVDWMRNSYASTVAAPLSLRPRPRASVAMPITWGELADTDPDRWTLGDALERVPDLPEFPAPSSLPIDAIDAAAADLGVDLDTHIDRFGRES